jgi:hypothetical protein
MEVAKWLLTLDGKINIHAENDDALRSSCHYGHIEVVKWLLTLDKFDEKMVDKHLPETLHEYAFQLGYLPVKKMLPAYEKYKVKILEEIRQKNTDGSITVFEIKGIPELITMYI